MSTTNRFGRMVQEYYVERFGDARRRRLERTASLKTRRDVLKFQDEVRGKIRQCFGPLPAGTPLNARTTGRIEHDKFTIEKVTYESRPGFLVTANLYIPRGLRKPAPCVLGTCGHSDTAKAAPAYQSFAQGLARKGFVSLLFDPISQGERVQYPGPDERMGDGLTVNRPSLGLCSEHTQIGRQMSMVGEFFGTWRTNDGIRSLDYLLSRPEVDPKRVGITGLSGGGTMTTWIAGNDDRFTMAAPGCFITTLLSNLENENPADAEQIPPRMVELGLDEYDLFVPFAPKPLILLTAANDFFDQRGSIEAYEQLRHVYRLLGAERNIRLYTGPGKHAYSRDLREAMYGFFCGHAGLKAAAKEPELVIHKEQELFATPEGSTLKAGSKRVFDFISEKAASVGQGRKPVARTRLVGLLKRTLAIPDLPAEIHHRVLRERNVDGHRLQTYALQTEPGIHAVITMPLEGVAYRVPPEKDCTLLVSHLSAFDDLHSGHVPAGVLSACGRVFGLDVRGIGESAPNTLYGGDVLEAHSGEYFNNAHGLLLGESYLGRRVYDVLCTLAWLRGHGYRRIHLAGRGFGAITALLAGTIDGRADRLTLVNGLLSYQELTQTPIFKWQISCLPHGGLLGWDLADCYRAVAGSTGSRQAAKLSIHQPWDAQMSPLNAAAARAQVAAMGLDPSVLAGAVASVPAGKVGAKSQAKPSTRPGVVA